TLDSLLQRLGRCYRKRIYNLDKPNVFIYSKDVRGIGTIYDKEIHNMSLKKISYYDIQRLSEKQKINMVSELYSRESLEGTEFLKEFETALSYLDSITGYVLNNKEAQRLLRDIDSKMVIPRRVFEDIQSLLNRFAN